jgi:hypothetical protein
MAEEFESEEDVEFPVNVANQFALSAGENLPNHTLSQQGKGRFVRPMLQSVPTFRTKQEAYRFAGWLLALSVTLPDEDGAHDFDEVYAAILEA